MIKSMTGFGQASFEGGHFQLNIEVRSLNSKFLDLNLRLPKLFTEKELEIRNLITEKLERGKVSISIDYQQQGQQEPQIAYNKDLFKAYYIQLQKLANTVEASQDSLFQLALNSPGVTENKFDETLTEEDWNNLKNTLLKAMADCEVFRVKEGAILLQKFHEYINTISKGLASVNEIDPKRVQRVREKLKGGIHDFFGDEGFDKNRLEQEIIFYIEKLDIQEEIVRLGTHLEYFKQVLDDKQSNGKKLGFIAQEIGREINTIGSKSNDADMQKVVVVMKEELEKIKEQLNNIL
jgi:uncharacterized protein (TIGR00255 family)